MFKHAVITYLTYHGVKMEEINDIAHFAKGSTILKNHYAISDPQRKIHSLIGNVISSEAIQSSTSFTPSTTPLPLVPSSVLIVEKGFSSEVVSNSALPSFLSSLSSPKVRDIINMRENACNERNNVLSVTHNDLLNNGGSVDKVDILNVPSKITNDNSTSSQVLNLGKGIKPPRKVRSKQVDLLSPEYLTAKLNNERVINIKHPSLLPRLKPNRNPSQVSASISSNDEDSLLSDSNSDTKSDSSVFSSDSHVSEEKTDLVN
jgi:hypothetical protein